MVVGQKKHSLRERVEAALAEFQDDPQSVGFHFRLDLSALLCEMLDEKGWSQKRLAEEANMLEPVVSRIINADSNCKLDTAGRLLYALGVREGDIVLCRNETRAVQMNGSSVDTPQIFRFCESSTTQSALKHQVGSTYGEKEIQIIQAKVG